MVRARLCVVLGVRGCHVITLWSLRVSAGERLKEISATAVSRCRRWVKKGSCHLLCVHFVAPSFSLASSQGCLLSAGDQPSKKSARSRNFLVENRRIISTIFSSRGQHTDRRDVHPSQIGVATPGIKGKGTQHTPRVVRPIISRAQSAEPHSLGGRRST